MPRTHSHADQANADDDKFFDASPEALNQAAQGRLKSFIERVQRLESEKAEVAESIKEVFAEAKGDGFDTKIIRKVVARLKKDKAKLAEEDALIDLYLSAIGELPDTL
jgi:uncharacterized protein (UPF0335 family)